MWSYAPCSFKYNFHTLLRMKILWVVRSGSSQSNLSSEICSRHAGFCARPAVTPGDGERLSQASLAASDTHPLRHTFILTPMNSSLRPHGFLGGTKKVVEKVWKKRRHVLDMTELRQRPIGGNCMTERAIRRPQYLRHMPSAPCLVPGNQRYRDSGKCACPRHNSWGDSFLYGGHIFDQREIGERKKHNSRIWNKCHLFAPSFQVLNSANEFTEWCRK